MMGWVHSYFLDGTVSFCVWLRGGSIPTVNIRLWKKYFKNRP
jgi:hypothetical protein